MAKAMYRPTSLKGYYLVHRCACIWGGIKLIFNLKVKYQFDTFNRMVKQIPMDAIFKALADPTRRSIIERVSSGPLSVEVLSPYYQMSAPALSKHLRVLEQAKLIKRTKESRNVIVSIEPQSLNMLEAWVQKYTKFWNTNFDALEKLLNKK